MFGHVPKVRESEKPTQAKFQNSRSEHVPSPSMISFQRHVHPLLPIGFSEDVTSFPHACPQTHQPHSIQRNYPEYAHNLQLTQRVIMNLRITMCILLNLSEIIYTSATISWLVEVTATLLGKWILLNNHKGY